MIRKRGNSWGVRVYSPHTNQQIWIGSYPTRKEAREAEAKATLEHTSHRKGRSEWTVSQFADRWLTAYHGPGTARPESTTLAHNTNAVRPFIREFGGRKLSGFGRDEARDYAAEHAWRARVVKAMFEDAIRDGRLAASPFAKVTPRQGKGRQNIDPLTVGEVDRLADIAMSRLGFYGPHFAALIRFAAWTGLRPGELGGMEWPDVDWRQETLTVRRQSRNDRVVEYTKTKAARTIALPGQAIEALASVDKVGVFVWHTTRGDRVRPNNIRYAWRQVRDVFEGEQHPEHWLARRLRVDPGDHLDPYELRHFCGSALADAGLGARDIAAYLGNSVEVCERTYVHEYRDRQQDRVRDAFARVGQVRAKEAS